MTCTLHLCPLLALWIAGCAAESGPAKRGPENRGGDPSAGDAYWWRGDDGGLGDSGPRVPIAVHQLCPAMSQAFCAAEQACCTDSTQKYATYEDCVGDETTQCRTDLEPVLTDPQTVYDGQAAAGFQARYKTYATTCDPAVTAWSVSATGLTTILDGTKSAGRDCTPPNLANPSDPANFAALVSCQKPQVCKLAVVVVVLQGSCAEASGPSGGCYTDLECQPPLRCDPDQNWAAGGGVCKPRLANSVACGRDGDCASLNCHHAACAAATANSAYCIGS